MALVRWIREAMFGDCAWCGHSIVYHLPLVGCAKCSCEEFD
jgi:hypothetical protein